MLTMKKLTLVSFCAMALLSCGKESPKLTVTPTDIVLYADGTKQITTNATDATFEVKDDFYASVESNGIVTANKVGETDIIVSSAYGSASIPVTVLPQYTLYPDVDMLIGKNLSAVTAVMGSSYETTTNNGKPMYMYKNPTSYCEGIGFVFSGNTCDMILVAIPTTHTTKITKALIERYDVAGMSNDIYYFLNHDRNVMILLTVYSYKAIAVGYTAYDDTKASNNDPIPAENFLEFLEHLN